MNSQWKAFGFCIPHRNHFQNNIPFYKLNNNEELLLFSLHNKDLYISIHNHYYHNLFCQCSTNIPFHKLNILFLFDILNNFLSPLFVSKHIYHLNQDNIQFYIKYMQMDTRFKRVYNLDLKF